MAYQLNQQKFLSVTELMSLRGTLEKFATESPRDVALLNTLIYTGARASEALNIRACDLNVETHSVLIRGLKKSNDREIPVPKWLFKQLITIRAKLSGETLIFDICYSRLDQIWQVWRPAPKKLHSLRHTFAIELFKKHKDLRLVQVALGHRNIQNTIIYAEYVYSSSELQKLLL